MAGSLDRATLEGFADETLRRTVTDGEIVARQDDSVQEVGMRRGTRSKRGICQKLLVDLNVLVEYNDFCAEGVSSGFKG